MLYAELFCQSNFSFLTGASHPEELVLQADFLRYHAIAITDECSLAGVVRAHTAIKEHQLNVRQIVGSMFWLSGECQCLLLCPDRLAYAELCRIITNARRRCTKGEYQLSEWDLMSAKHCLILWLPCGKSRDLHWGRWLQRHHTSGSGSGCKDICTMTTRRTASIVYLSPKSSIYPSPLVAAY